ncbi:unnamed protein product, partial [Closterium sp. Naga37s-1]
QAPCIRPLYPFQSSFLQPQHSIRSSLVIPHLSTCTLKIILPGRSPPYHSPRLLSLPTHTSSQHLYRQSSRELRRLDSAARSPVYAAFSQLLHGAPTIRAFHAQVGSVSSTPRCQNQCSALPLD